MASDADVSDISTLFERLVRNREMSLFLPFIFGLSESSPPRENGEGEQDRTGETERSADGPGRERIILVNPFTQGMVVIDGASSLEALLREIVNNGGGGKGGKPPASKESIEAMPRVEVKNGDGGECVVCLEEFDAGLVVKEMPCKHRFHDDCIDKWLGIHGSCPVCRYEMPVEDDDEGKKRDGGESEGERRRRRFGNGEVWVSFSFNRASSRRTNEDSNRDAPSADADHHDSIDDSASNSTTGDSAEAQN